MTTNPPPPHRSKNASGSIGDYDPYKQRPTYRTIGPHFQPGDPNSPSKYEMRTQIRALNTLWRSMTAAQRNSWATLAKRWGLPLYQSFIKRNCLNRPMTRNRTP